MKRKQVVKEIARDHPDIASKLKKKLEVKKTPGRPNIESQIESLHETILSVVVPESTGDKCRRLEIYHSVPSLDDLHKALKKGRIKHLLPAFAC